MVAAAVLTLLCQTPAQELPKWEEILSNMHRDIRTVKGTHEEWALEGGAEETGFMRATFLRWIDGRKFRQETRINGELKLAFASNGTRIWTALPTNGYYIWDDQTNDPTQAKWNGLEKEKSTPSFNVGMTQAYDIAFNFSPRPTVTKVEEVENERRVHAVMKVEDRQMNLVIRFEKDKWLLKGLDGIPSVKGGSMLSFKRIKAERNQIFESDIFGLDKKIVSGLRELTGANKEALKKAVNGSG